MKHLNLVRKAVSLLLVICFIFSMAIPSFAANEIIYGYRVKMSDFDMENAIKAEISSIELMLVEGYVNRWAIIIDGTEITEKTGSSFSISYNDYPLNFSGIGTENAFVETEYQSTFAITKTLKSTVTFSTTNNTQNATLVPYEGGTPQTFTATLVDGYYDFGTMSFTYEGKTHSFAVKINANTNTAYITRDGQTYSYSLGEGNAVYLEWWVDAQEISANYLDTNLTKLPFAEAKTHVYSDGQIDSALSNYTITMRNNLTGLTHQANLVTTLTYWARKEGSGTAVGDGSYNEYTSGVRVVKQWPELSSSEKTYFGGGNDGDVDYARRPFAVFPGDDKFTGIGKEVKTTYTTGEWGAWSDYIYSTCTPNDNTECQKANYIVKERSISTGGWSQYPEYTKSCTSTNGMPTSTGTQVSCTSGYIKKMQRDVRRSDDWNETFATSCTPYFPTSNGTMVQCTEGGKLRKTRTITVGAWDKDGSYVSSCTAGNATKCASGYYLKQTRTATPGSWTAQSYSKTCSESGTLKCVSGYYLETTTEVTLGSWSSSYGDWYSGTATDSAEKTCVTIYRKVKYNNSGWGTAYNQTCENCQTTKPSGVEDEDWRRVYRYKCAADKSSTSYSYYYDETAASAGTNNSSVCTSSKPYIVSRTTYYQVSDTTTTESYVSSCTSSSTVTCTKGYQCKTRSMDTDTDTDYVSTCKIGDPPTSSTAKGTYYYVSKCTSGYYHKYTRSIDYGNWSAGTGASSCTASTASFSASDTSAKTETKCTSGYYYKTTRNISTGDWTSGYLDYSCSAVTNTITQDTNAGTYYDYSCSNGYVKTTTDITYGSWGTDYVKSCESVSAQKLVGYERTCEPGYYAKETREVNYGNWTTYEAASCTAIDPSEGKTKEVVCSSGSKYAKRTKESGTKDITVATKAEGVETANYGNRMTAKDIYVEANRLGNLAARAENIDILSAAGVDYDYSKGEWQSASLGWEGNETNTDVNTAAQNAFNQYLTKDRFIPWVFITAHWRATKAGVAYSSGPLDAGSVNVYKENADPLDDSATLTAYTMPEDEYDDDPPEVIPPDVPDEPERADSKVIYFDYRDPLTNYDPNDLPDNWKGYESLIEEIQNSDFSNAKFQVTISASDLKAMRDWTHEHGEDQNCDMLREFSYIFTGTTPEFDAWLQSGTSCRTS